VVPFFAVATDTITSCSLGRQYGPVFSLSFLDVYALNLGMIIPRLRMSNLERGVYF
jgi:hypothetical protein